MGSLTHATFLFFLNLCAGHYVFLGAVRPSRLGPAYYLIHGLPSLGVVAIALWLTSKGGLSAAAFYSLLLFLGLGAFYSLFATRFRIAAPILFALSLLALLFSILEMGKQESATVPFVVHSLLSLVLLGAASAAMALGHWYLVQPKLSISELSRLSYMLFAAVVVRLAWMVWGLAPLLSGVSSIEKFLIGSNEGIFILMRVLWGIALPVVLSALVLPTVKIRSTQSATGLLYVVVVCVLIGEILSTYLGLTYAVYL